MPRKTITKIEQLKGLKFRTYNAMIGRIAALAGAIPTQIEVPDLPTAFATGRVDVMITSASTGVNTKAQDYLTDYIDMQAWQPRNIVFVNKAAFDKLSATEKKAVLDAAKVAEVRGWKASIEEMDDQDRGAQGRRRQSDAPSPELKAGFAKSAQLSPPSGKRKPVPTARPCWRLSASNRPEPLKPDPLPRERVRRGEGLAPKQAALPHGSKFHAPHSRQTLSRLAVGLGAMSGDHRPDGRRAIGRPILDGTLALLHLPRTDFVILSLAEICGYLLAGREFPGAGADVEGRRAYSRHHGTQCVGHALRRSSKSGPSRWPRSAPAT